MIKSGIHPENLSILFLALEREDFGYVPESMEVFMSHPHLKSRLDEALQYELPEDFEVREFRFDWEAVQQEMKSI